jgi:hypothetical protein
VQNKFNAKSLTVDVTTNSIVFDCMSASGSWDNHRFGNRAKYAELSFPVLKKFLEQTPDLSHLTLSSVFGDPVCYRDFEELIEFCFKRFIRLTVITYGMGSESRFQLLKDSFANVIVKICGIEEEAGSVFLGAEWDTINKNLACLDDRIILDEKTCLEFSVYHHNTHQISEIQSLCSKKNWNFKAVPGILNSGNIGSVIDLDGNWLYDIHSENHSGHSKVKTVEGWHALKHYVHISEKLDFSRKGMPIDELQTANLLFLGVTGEVYNNFESFYRNSGVVGSKNCGYTPSSQSNIYYLV